MYRYRHLTTLTTLLALAWPISGFSDTPLGWINNANMSAYTTTQGELELSASYQAVNGTIDFLDIREDLFASNRRLVGKSGDLEGARLEAHYGITDFLSVFARYQEHELTVDLGEISSINVLEIDDSLDTSQQEVGLKWMLYEADLLNANNERTALSLQVSGFRNETDNFDLVTDEISLDNLTLIFTNPQTFSVSDLEDDGWQARLLYSTSLANFGIGSAWVGYGRSNAESGTDSDLDSATFAGFFKQDFRVAETYYYFGASLNFRITPRLPVTINYEYISIQDSEFNRIPDSPSIQLPGFLSSANVAAEDGNHTLSARASYWISPQLNLSISGNLYSNQFLGKLPHYNNPLSGSFSSVPYGFIGIELGYRL